MNILSCLTPKSEVRYINDDASLLKTLQNMQESNFAAIPIINKTTGKYIGTITAGDILGCIYENYDLSVKKAADIQLKNVRRTRDNKAVSASAGLEEVLDIAMTQNFVPVIDDDESFIGIITRRDLMGALRKAQKKEENKK